MMTFKDKIKKHINNDEIFKKLEKYVDEIEAKNKVINLTGFSGDTLWKEGIYESIITLEEAFPNFDEFSEKKILDIGSGAGFPSVPFVLVHPELELIIFEPQQKRVNFLRDTMAKLKMNARVQITRVEDAKMFNYFDFVTARAVAEFKHLAEASIHIGKIGAEYAFVKGPKAKEELEAAKKVSQTLGISPFVQNVEGIEDKDVKLIKYMKTKITPGGYPKQWKDIIG